MIWIRFYSDIKRSGQNLVSLSIYWLSSLDFGPISKQTSLLREKMTVSTFLASLFIHICEKEKLRCLWTLNGFILIMWHFSTNHDGRGRWVTHSSLGKLGPILCSLSAELTLAQWLGLKIQDDVRKGPKELDAVTRTDFPFSDLIFISLLRPCLQNWGSIQYGVSDAR